MNFHSTFIQDFSIIRPKIGQPLKYDLKKIIREHYAELNRAYKSKELNGDRLNLHDDAKMVGISDYFDGKKAIVEVLGKCIQLMTEVEIQHQYFDHNSCCTIMTTSSIIPEIKIKSTDRMVVSDGCITEMYVYYDTKAWELLMQRLQTLSSTASYFQKDVT